MGFSPGSRQAAVQSGTCLTCDTVLFDYATGNCLGTIHFIWKVPSDGDPTILTTGNAECYSLMGGLKYSQTPSYQFITLGP